MNEQTPLLSVGIIFKNDIRCIERCLKALQPLREAVPCEVVMADTGSTDGSRKIAEKYAEILFDFPWINDFSAARNAVMDRCSGRWYISVDTDEYLQKDISELVGFLMQENGTIDFATVIVRSYSNYELTGNYSDLMGLRMVRLSTGIRYHGAIHESFDFGEEIPLAEPLNQTIFDHDGYVEFNQNSEKGRAKLKRNVELIRRELENRPNDILLRLQLLESGSGEPDYTEQIRKMVELIRQKQRNWDQVGPSALCCAIWAANDRKLPERDEWLQMAEEWFPNSMYTRLDVEWSMFLCRWDEKDFDDCVLRGERFLSAMEDFKAGKDPTARVLGSLHTATPIQEQRVRILLSYAYSHCGAPNLKRAFELLQNVDGTILEPNQVTELLKGLHELHYRSDFDTSGLILAVWDGITRPQPSEEQAELRKAAFIQTANLTFHFENQAQEQSHKDFHRFAYTLYIPLQAICEVGNAAKLMASESPAELSQVLSCVRNWNELSASALLHALECRVRFPLREKPMGTEEMDGLASRLAGGKERFLPLALHIAENADPADWQELCWARGLILAAVRTYPWSAKEQDEEQGMTLARVFVSVEKTFLPMCYSGETLREDHLFVLPPLHRFGWYCTRAFDAANAGDASGYVRLLREGLTACKEMKDMVAFLLDWAQRREKAARIGAASPELIALAKQVKMILARFDPGDPAVEELKNSPSYRQVAWLIEEPAQLAFETPMQ